MPPLRPRHQRRFLMEVRVHHEIQPPQPFSTSGFPVLQGAGPVNRKRTHHSTTTDTVCPICLDPVLQQQMVRLGCDHRLHRQCCMGLLPWLQGNVSCPLCRSTIDPLHVPDILGIKGGLRPSLLLESHAQVSLLKRTFAAPGSAVRQVDAESCPGVVHRLGKTRDAHGFVYNTALLCIDRALHHQQMFRMFIESTMATWRGPFDACRFIEDHLDDHVLFLIKTAHVYEP